MEFFEVINKRRSVRKFTAEPVPEAVIEKALDAAVLAPNSSNMQTWEFYWVKSADKKAALVQACFAQGAASSAAELVVAVSRVDTWRRNRDALVDILSQDSKLPHAVLTYYRKVIPMCYMQDPFGILGIVKKIIFTAIGFFRPVARKPLFRSELFEVVTKSTALGCENLMLAVVAQGYDCCPMEGFDERRVKKILGLNCKSHVVMVVGIGKADLGGVSGERIRLPRDFVVKRA
jgi:nitroreductase